MSSMAAGVKTRRFLFVVDVVFQISCGPLCTVDMFACHILDEILEGKWL
jgi:hypothetical protein